MIYVVLAGVSPSLIYSRRRIENALIICPVVWTCGRLLVLAVPHARLLSRAGGVIKHGRKKGAAKTRKKRRRARRADDEGEIWRHVGTREMLRCR